MGGARKYPQGLHRLWEDCIAGGAQAKLPILVAAKGEQFACVRHCQCVRVAAGHLHNVAARQGPDGLRDEDIITVAVPQTAKVSPAERRTRSYYHTLSSIAGDILYPVYVCTGQDTLLQTSASACTGAAMDMTET